MKLYFYRQITPKIYENSNKLNDYLYCGCKNIVNQLEFIMGIIFKIVIGKINKSIM